MIHVYGWLLQTHIECGHGIDKKLHKKVCIGCNYSSISQLHEVRAWVNNCLHGFYLDVVTYPCPNLHAKLNVVVTKRAPIVRTNSEHHRR